MVVAGAFDGDEDVAEAVFLDGLADEMDHVVQSGPSMFDLGRRDQDVRVEIRQHPLGACFGAVDGDHAKRLGPACCTRWSILPLGLTMGCGRVEEHRERWDLRDISGSFTEVGSNDSSTSSER